MELVLKYIHRCHHVPLAHKRKINDIEPYIAASDYFLKLTPEVMQGSVDDAANANKTTIWYVNGASSSDSLYANYHAYLFDATHKIATCRKACDKWTNKYRYHKTLLSEKQQHHRKIMSGSEQSQRVQIIKQFLEELEGGGGGGGEDTSEKGKLHDSLQSIGESSGYESFRYRPEDEECEIVEELKEPWKVSNRKNDEDDIDLSEDLFVKGSVQLGMYDTNLELK